MKFVIIMLAGFGSFTALAQNPFKFNEGLFDHVEITHASGQITVRNTKTDGHAELKASNSVSKHECSSYYMINNRTLKIITEKKIFVIKSECAQNFEFLVSKTKNIKISLGVGHIDVKGLFPSIEADLGSGAVSIKGTISKLDLDVASGSISVFGLDGYGKISLLSGNLDVQYKDPKKKLNQLFVSKSVGNTNIKIPKGFKAESKLVTLLGNVSSKIKSSPTGQFYFSVQTRVGDILMDTF